MKFLEGYVLVQSSLKGWQMRWFCACLLNVYKLHWCDLWGLSISVGLWQL